MFNTFSYMHAKSNLLSKIAFHQLPRGGLKRLLYFLILDFLTHEKKDYSYMVDLTWEANGKDAEIRSSCEGHCYKLGTPV